MNRFTKLPVYHVVPVWYFCLSVIWSIWAFANPASSLHRRLRQINNPGNLIIASLNRDHVEDDKWRSGADLIKLLWVKITSEFYGVCQNQSNKIFFFSIFHKICPLNMSKMILAIFTRGIYSQNIKSSTSFIGFAPG